MTSSLTNGPQQTYHPWMTANAANQFTVAFGEPEAGCMPVHVAAAGRAVQFIADHEPCDSLYKLTKCLALALHGIERHVEFSTDATPIEFSFVPGTRAETLRLEIRSKPESPSHAAPRSPMPMLDVSLPLGAMCGVFLAALEELGARFTAEAFQARWKRAFPHEAVDRLRQQLSRFDLPPRRDRPGFAASDRGV